jgi:hypothetical protein
MRIAVAAEAGGGYAAGSPGSPLAGIGAARAELRGVLEQDLAGVDRGVVTDAVDELVKLERTTAALKAKVVRAAERAGVHDDVGAVDAVAMLKDRAQLSGRDAKRAVELGRQLERLPRTAEALAAGGVGVEQAQQLADAARTGRLGMPKLVESQLLDAAKTSTPERFRDEVKRREQEADGDRLLKDERLAHARRSVRRWRRDDGMYEGHLLLDPTSGEAFDTLLRAFETPDPAGTPPELRRSPEQRAADALVQAAHVALDAGEAPESGGERPHVSVVVTAEALAGADGAPPAEAQWAGPISEQALERWLCDAGIARVVAKGSSQLLDLGRTTRKWSAAQRRGIVALDGGCRFPGCDRPAAWTNIHHVRFWKKHRGRTDIGNGVLLCVRHHHLVHEGGWKLSMDASTRVVTVVSPNRRTRLTSEPRGIIPRTATTARPPG